MIKTLMLAVSVICANTARAGDADGLTGAINGFVNQQKIQGAELTTYPSYPSDGSIVTVPVAPHYSWDAQPNPYRQLPPAGTILFPVRFVREKTVSRNIDPNAPTDTTQARNMFKMNHPGAAIPKELDQPPPAQKLVKVITTTKVLFYKDAFGDWFSLIVSNSSSEQ
jgi:hypothetical protein